MAGIESAAVATLVETLVVADAYRLVLRTSRHAHTALKPIRIAAPLAPNIIPKPTTRKDSAVTQSHAFAGVGGYYAGTECRLAGAFRRETDF